MKNFAKSDWILGLLLALPAVLPAAVLAVCGPLADRRALAASALAGAACSLVLIHRGLLRPVRGAAEAIKKFYTDDYKIEKPLAREGWPETAQLISALNKVILELGAYHAFHINQVLEERGKAQALIDAIMDGVLLLDDGGRLIHANRTALKLLGIGTVDPEILLCSMVTEQSFKLALEELTASGEDHQKREIALEPADENCSIARHFRLTSANFPLSTLKRPGRVIIIRDITAEKEMDNARETLFHMITHDMRAPVTSIQGYAELLQKNIPQNERTGIYLSSIFRSANRLKGMIDDILNMVKMSRGCMELRTEETDAAAFCERVMNVTRPLAERKEITLTQAPEADTKFRADISLLERVAVNLISNAIKFTPRHGRVSLSCRFDGEEVRFEVEDNGPGIPKGKEEEIFELYSQLEEHRHMGFGLGLAMCKMAVELHKGRIWADTGVPAGSRFVFTLPRTAG